MKSKNQPALLIIFGGTGDLAKKKLSAALYNIFKDEKISENFAILSIGRKEISKDDYKNMIKEGIENSLNSNIKSKDWESFEKKIFYYSLEFNKGEDYKFLEKYISDFEIAEDNKYTLSLSHNNCFVSPALIFITLSASATIVGFLLA